MTFQEQVRAVMADQGATSEERWLLEDEIHSAHRPGEGVGVNELWRVELGATAEGAYFKPVNGVNVTAAYLFDHTRESVLLSEVVAYRLAWALGPPIAELVPPCVIRSVPSIDPHAPGALTAERFDARDEDLFFHAPQLALRAAFFDALIANQDRSRANLLFDASRQDLALIDHGFAFPRDGDLHNVSLLLDWRRRAGQVELAAEEASALETLLGDLDLLGLRRYLEPERAEPVAARAQRMLDGGTIA